MPSCGCGQLLAGHWRARDQGTECRRAEMRGSPVSRILSKGLPPLDDQSSSPAVTCGVKLPTRIARGEVPLRCLAARPRSLFGVAPGGACLAGPVASPAVGSYPTVSPLPRRAWRSVLCGAFPGVAPAGRYPAPSLHGVRTFLVQTGFRGYPDLCMHAVIQRSAQCPDRRAAGLRQWPKQGPATVTLRATDRHPRRNGWQDRRYGPCPRLPRGPWRADESAAGTS